MADKPKRASEYRSEQVALVRSTCLYVATKLGDLMEDVVVIGGLVPSLLIDQRDLPDGVSTHVGTMDLDVGLKLALLDHGRYHTLTERLRAAKFTPPQRSGRQAPRYREGLRSHHRARIEACVSGSATGPDRGQDHLR